MFGLYRTITAENETDSNPTRENSVGFCNIFDTINIDTSPEAKKTKKLDVKKQHRKTALRQQVG